MPKKENSGNNYFYETGGFSTKKRGMRITHAPGYFQIITQSRMKSVRDSPGFLSVRFILGFRIFLKNRERLVNLSHEGVNHRKHKKGKHCTD